MSEKRPTHNTPLHPRIWCRLLAIISHERRIAITAAREARREWQEQTDSFTPEEVPRTGSLSGWMRNDREANEYLDALKREDE